MFRVVAGDLGHRIIVATGALALTGITVLAVVASREPSRTAFAVTGGIEAHECPGGPLAANIPPDDVIVLAGSSYEGHLGLWRAVTWDNTHVNPPVTRSLWVTDDDLRGVITDPAEISGGQVIRDPAFDNGCDPDAQAGATVLSREISVPDTTVTETTAAPLTTGAVSTEGTAPAAPRPKVTLAPRPTPAPPPTPPPTVAPAPPTPPTPPPTPSSVTQPTVTVTTAKVIVPNLLQLDRDDAEALLARLGLKANVLGVDLKFNDSRVGFVVSQLPEAGSAVDPDSLVTVGVGNPGPVLVPNVMGLVRSEAEKVIKDAGLTSKVSLEGDDAGRVVKQDPAGDAFLPPQGLVTLTLEANSVE